MSIVHFLIGLTIGVLLAWFASKAIANAAYVAVHPVTPETVVQAMEGGL